jgi:hypothetical protein
MSRAYRIKVSETIRKVIRAEDHVRTQLEVLQILPADQMADLLAEELIKQGFEREGKTVTRTDGDIAITVDLETGAVHVQAEASTAIALNGERSGLTYDDAGPSRQDVEEKLRADLQKELESDAEKQTGELQKQVTDKLEGHLADIRKQLDQAVNKATAQALKQKAAQIGQIKELTEDEDGGSLTIVVEV